MTLEELERQFNTEASCRDYLFQIRWPNGFVCPKCGNDKAWPVRKVLFECAKCHHQVSVIAGTIFQDTRKPLTMWFRAIWWVTSQKNGSSALGLQRILGLNSYQTAWTWLHKLRTAMVRPGRETLSGYVEVDESYIGGEEPQKRGRGAIKKVLVAIAVEVVEERIGRIRIGIIKDASADSLTGFIRNNIRKGSTIHSDGWNGYNEIESMNYKRNVSVIKGSGKDAHELLPHVHLVATLLKRWLLGTHQGAVSEKHLDYYLDEFTFRFNRRYSGNRGLLFYRLLENAVLIETTSYKALVEKDGNESKTQYIVVT